MTIQRQPFYEPADIYSNVHKKIEELRDAGSDVDYLTLVPDGEPTLDKNLGIVIKLLKDLNIKIAVITNSSLLWNEDVRNELACADWVSVKIDSVIENTWREVNRPAGHLNLDIVLNGISEFACSYKGMLVTETMLVRGMNDSGEDLLKIADFIKCIEPVKSYIMVPTRPPAEANVEKPSEEKIRNAYDIFKNISGADTECITGDEGDDFYFTNDIADDLLNITSVHPVREEVIDKLLKNRGADKGEIEYLIKKNMIRVYKYAGKRFYKRVL
jgi:wyosine [tRNA(Phe)-imidazoG37] synthetase (radical SAM superfamily)